MPFHILLFLSLFLISASITHCSRSNGSLPYPSLKEQRAQLADKSVITPYRVLDSAEIIHDLQYLASDTCNGRQPGTVGHDRAMQRIISRMRAARLDSFDHSLKQIFSGSNINGSDSGINIIGWVKGSVDPNTYLVVSAHYDHLGTSKDGKVYYGADDNASGVACLMALAKYFKEKPHAYSLIFAAFDREETNLQGSYYFVDNWVHNSGKEKIKLDLNLDMIARSDNNEIFACGARYYPSLRKTIDQVQNNTSVHLLMGHDSGPAKDDWTNQSDHYAFYKNNIPFLYIGVEDHPDYHQPTDTYSRINYHNYIENCNLTALLLNSIQ
jgi:hypothetical protein